jgi:hypothetical protein
MLPRKRLRLEVDGGGCDFFFFLLSSLIFRVFVISLGPFWATPRYYTHAKQSWKTIEGFTTHTGTICYQTP